jgi:hypothetical protein
VPDELSIVNSMLYEHGALMQYLRMLNAAINEQETLFLQKSGEWTAGQLQTLKQKHLNLKNSITTLYDSLINHFSSEENALKPFVGQLLLAGLELEHKDIAEHLNQTRLLQSEIEPEKLSREELMAKSYEIRRSVELAAQLIEANINKEDGILHAIRRVLLKEDKRPTGH